MQDSWKGTYLKIHTLYKRDEKTHRIIEGDYSKEEFGNIKKWSVSEKVNGTNTRISLETRKTKFDGKTDNAQLPTKLIQHLHDTFTVEKMNSAFIVDENIPTKVILFGEGYGTGIQSGGLYRKDVGFILFDVWVDGWWLQRDDVYDISVKLGIPCVPGIGLMTIDEIVHYVKSRPNSLVAEQPMTIEGVVARAYPQMLFRDGTPIMFKLKVRDYL